MKAITYKTIKYIQRRACLVPALLFLLLPGCSYVMDSIEGAITDRASFSIDAEYVSGTGVIINWTETGTSSNFAGYEIYITEFADDEYAGYTIVANKFNDASLGNIITGTYTDTAPPSGVYFYRVGVIAWDEQEEDKRVAEWGAGYESNQVIYNSHTDISRISGAKRVVIPE